MSEHFSNLGISVNRVKAYIAAAAVMTVLVLTARGVCAAAVQNDPHDQANDSDQIFSEFAYVVNGIYGGDFSGYRMNIFTGELTPLPGSPFAPGPYFPEYAQVVGVAIDTRDRFLYSAAVGGVTFPGNVILGFSIGANGVLTPLPSAATTGGPFESLAVDPSNRFLYTTGPYTGIVGFSINAATGLLTSVPGGSFDTGGVLVGTIIDPAGRFVYVRDFLASALLGFKINPATGALTQIPGSPFAGVSGAVVIDPTGRFLYAFEGIGGVNINEYTIDNRTGALTLSPRSPFAAPVGVVDAVVDPTGRFLYALDSTALDTQASNRIVGFFINPFTGGLTRLPSAPIPTGSDPGGLTVDPTGRFVYVANEGDNTVSEYAIEPWSGALQPLPGSPVPTGSGPTGIAVGAFISHH